MFGRSKGAQLMSKITMKHSNFSRTRLSAAISMLLGASAVTPVYAQQNNDKDEPQIEVIQVSGIRGSLARSQDLKRESSGVVDAISAEDIGKFPDTNLAESLQRITGVTISRENNEGSQVTVRGFGPDFNLITVNGRQMPGTGNSRSFNFENLASTGVKTLQVFKSSRVDVPSGGLGATVDIETAKPLSNPGLTYTFSTKGLYDESNQKGDDVTPEIAGLYSQTFFDDKFGISLAASYQERDFQRQEAEVPGWNANVGPFDNAPNGVDPRPMATSEEEDMRDGVADGRVGNSFLPRQIAYRVDDIQRNRTNTHLTLQYAPRDDMTFTADYMYNESETAKEGFGYGIWFNFGGNVTDYELDQNGTAIRLTEVDGDFAHNRASETLLVEQESIGFNFEWQINDDWHVEFDYHDSNVERDDGGDEGTRARTNVILGPNNIESKTYDFTTGDGIPQFFMTWPGGAAEAATSDFEPLFTQFFRNAGESAVEQFQLHTQWENPNDSFITKVKFGATRTEQTLSGREIGLVPQGAQQFQGLTTVFRDDLFTRTGTDGVLDEFAGSLQTNYFYDFDISQVLSSFAGFFPGFQADPFNAPGNLVDLNSQSSVTEETEAAYVSAAMYFEPFDMPLDINVGVRHERTDVTATVLQDAPIGLRWFGGAEWRTLLSPGSNVTDTGDYDVTLPSIDFKLEVAEDMFTRISWGKSIARVNDLSNLLPNQDLSIRPVPVELGSTRAGGGRTGGFGNPSLEPFESTNFDVTFEWYYKDDSYFSVGYFRKDVKNFIISSRTILEFDGLRDPTAGPRYTQAIADLQAAGLPATNENIFNQIVANGGGTTVNGQPAIDQNPEDPLAQWDVGQPINNPEDETVDGIEVAVQHVFGDSGFGVGLNATIVDAETTFNPELLVPQTEILAGVSDSANAQVFYEDDDWSARITYTWRDDYLTGQNVQERVTSDGPPTFVRDTAIIDFNVSYQVTENLTVFAEGFNITNETEQRYGRYENQFVEAAQFGPRYSLGARYTFE